jgi:deoxyribonuclease IV
MTHIKATELVRLNESNSVLNAFQIFVSPPHNQVLPEENSYMISKVLPKIKKIKQRLGFYGAVHGKYIYNFCRPNQQLQQDMLEYELMLAQRIGFDLVIHQGKNLPDLKQTNLQAIDHYVAQISTVLDQTFEYSNRILLENSAHQGNEIGYSLTELAYIYNQFSDEHRQHRLGICLDTCHAFVAGDLDLRDPIKVQQYLVQFDQLIGLQYLRLIHFNDSLVPFNSHNDRHGDLFHGYISNPKLGGSLEGFNLLIDIAHQRKIPLIFETPFNHGELHRVQCYMYLQSLKSTSLSVSGSSSSQPKKLKLNFLSKKFKNESK